MAKLKMRKEKGAFIVEYADRVMSFPTLHDALEYVWYRKFMALVSGEYIGYYNNTLYPVNSLLPPVVEKVAKFYDLGAEII
jgi:hypothetical protein